MSLLEFSQWVAYRRKRGSLHQGRRMDRGFAMLASMYANAHTKNGGFKISDFQPHEADDKPISLDEAMERWE
ncbi:phage tail assembly protein T [Pseudomonas nitroreducens]|uniref:phage tail assembly protein T n=1 Tax=Pseudomonas nitroreducens TaxID=46680 RepID=UPI002D7ECE26|nr:hypothetical protein [Pseudomonas nitroreducens]